MPQLPVMSGREVVRAFEKHGWKLPDNAAVTSSWSKPDKTMAREGYVEVPLFVD
jgi:hypothetical protein